MVIIKLLMTLYIIMLYNTAWVMYIAKDQLRLSHEVTCGCHVNHSYLWLSCEPSIVTCGCHVNHTNFIRVSFFFLFNVK